MTLLSGLKNKTLTKLITSFYFRKRPNFQVSKKPKTCCKRLSSSHSSCRITSEGFGDLLKEFCLSDLQVSLCFFLSLFLSFCLSVSLSLFVFLCSVCLSVSLCSVCLSVCLCSVCLFVSLCSVCLSLSLSLFCLSVSQRCSAYFYFDVHLSVSLCIFVSLCISMYLFVMSVCLSVFLCSLCLSVSLCSVCVLKGILLIRPPGKSFYLSFCLSFCRSLSLCLSLASSCSLSLLIKS
jgi:hypothetical protein